MIEQARGEWGQRLQVVLCGAPNSGKSTLLNRWSGHERVLVDEQPGTTRDPIEIQMNDAALPWSVWDTAGIRQEAQGLEARGIEMAKTKIRQADLALWLLSGNGRVWPEAVLTENVVGSKADLLSLNERQKIEEEIAKRGYRFWGWVSGQTGEGVVALGEQIKREWQMSGEGAEGSATRGRHLEALKTANQALRRLEGIREKEPLDILILELEEAVFSLGNILGRNVDAEVLDKIFSGFCVGK